MSTVMLFVLIIYGCGLKEDCIEYDENEYASDIAILICKHVEKCP